MPSQDTLFAMRPDHFESGEFKWHNHNANGTYHSTLCFRSGNAYRFTQYLIMDSGPANSYMEGSFDAMKSMLPFHVYVHGDYAASFTSIGAARSYVVERYIEARGEAWNA